ncbi:hypothetical protein L596_016431 [Steinernema carpocapsae]|uniref:Uncharacterized protein n=1 Tax=Steinernema carpocapsae TaxID=34508 RepID=A0A4U5NJ48_STECR|nr:hypothetical protein L596_016431 [Steinernema carpocapsae]
MVRHVVNDPGCCCCGSIISGAYAIGILYIISAVSFCIFGFFGLLSSPSSLPFVPNSLFSLIAGFSIIYGVSQYKPKTLKIYYVIVIIQIVVGGIAGVLFIVAAVVFHASLPGMTENADSNAMKTTLWIIMAFVIVGMIAGLLMNLYFLSVIKECAS